MRRVEYWRVRGVAAAAGRCESAEYRFQAIVRDATARGEQNLLADCE
jgi:hypothetical protein